MHQKLLFLTVIAIISNAIFWQILVPIWHFPDEQAHFGQVAFISEKGRNPIGQENDLTEEILLSERWLGTERDSSGNNRFTFHPEYKIDYTDSYFGFFEASISALARTSSKNNFIAKESSRYPPLYYLPASFIYQLFYNADLFVRIYAVRFWSLLLFFFTLISTYKIGILIFNKNNFLPIMLMAMVGFQPMMVFANVGVNSDSLGNLLFTVFIYYLVLLVIHGWKLKNGLIILFISLLSSFTKTQFFVIWPLIILLFLFLFIRDYQGSKKYSLVLIGFISLFFILSILFKLRIDPTGLINQLLTSFNKASFFKYTREYTISHTYREVLPWYWGVYDWLGITYPRHVHRIINLIILTGMVGYLKYIFSNLLGRGKDNKPFQVQLFLILISFLYFIAIALYDWFIWSTSGYQLGVQGRYFFPLISVQMLMIILGWREFWPEKFRDRGIKILGLLTVLLNFFALYTIAKTYYDLGDFKTFVIQVSQYKPQIIKGSGFVFLLLFEIITLIIFLLKYIKYQDEKILPRK